MIDCIALDMYVSLGCEARQFYWTGEEIASLQVEPAERVSDGTVVVFVPQMDGTWEVLILGEPSTAILAEIRRYASVYYKDHRTWFQILIDKIWN